MHFSAVGTNMDCAESTNTVTPSTFATNKCPKGLLYFTARPKSRGQTTVEFSLICLPFFIILFAIIDFAQIFFYENAMQNALREATRFATAGRVIQATNTDGSLAYETNSDGIAVPKAINDANGREASRNECIRYWFGSNCALKAFPVTSVQITSAPTLPGVPANVSTNSQGYLTLLSGYTVATNSGIVSTNSVPAVKGPGAANDYVQITAVTQVHTMTPLCSFLGGFSREGWNVYPVHVSAIIKNEPALLNFEHTNIYAGEP
jgi:Flp pilus assembly protein TadG